MKKNKCIENKMIKEPSKMASFKFDICLRKKITRAQIFRYFGYENRNNISLR